MLVSPSENTHVSSTVPGIVLSTRDSEKISICFLFGHLLYFVNSFFELFFTSDFFPIFFASILIYSIITSCVSHCNNQQVSKLFFGIYVSDKLIIVLRYGTVQWKRYGLHNQQTQVCIFAPFLTNTVTLGKYLYHYSNLNSFFFSFNR